MPWETAGSLAELRRVIRGFDPQVLVTDVGLPDGNGLDMVPQLIAEYPSMPIIVLRRRTPSPPAVRAAEQGKITVFSCGLRGVRRGHDVDFIAFAGGDDDPAELALNNFW